MKTKTIYLALLASLVLAAAPARAEWGTMDNVPAATLLLPYFEVSLDDQGQWPDNTTFTIGNASASAAVAHVTLWTDLGIPTLNFDVYLTGFDVELINLRLLFHGILPVTADDETDPSDTYPSPNGISNQGPISQDINFPPSGTTPPILTGPCQRSVYQRLSADDVAALRAAHTGYSSALLGGSCGGSRQYDNTARGFITVDTVNTCTALDPTDAVYHDTEIDTRNILFGEYWVIANGLNYSLGEPLVAIEAMPTLPAPGTYTFYYRLNGNGLDRREGLPTSWMGRFVNGGAFDGGTTAFVWRDAHWPRAPFSCVAAVPEAGQLNVTGFDEQEQVDYLRIGNYFPYAAQAVDLGDPSAVPLEVNFGFVFYDLKLGTADAPVVRQSYVTHAFSALGRFEGGFSVWPLDTADQPGGLSSNLTLPACMDGIDNDGHGDIDYPADPGCQNEDFPTEAPACLDGFDNDEDGLMDYPNDPGCASPYSFNEAPQCNDGIDNSDPDDLIDMNDPECTSPSDPSEWS